MPKSKPPLIMRLPRGLREQPAEVFIGVMVALVGLAYATGFSNSVIAREMGPQWQLVWGFILMTVSLVRVFATIRAKPAFERLALRAFTCTLLVYTGWLMTITSLRNATLTIIFAIVLAGLAEIRVWLLKAIINRADRVADELARHGGNDE